MTIRSFVCLFLLVFHAYSCSSTVRENDSSPKLETAHTSANQLATTVSNQSFVTADCKPAGDPRHAVVFDGVNYIKNSGWKVPPREGTDVYDSYEGGPPKPNDGVPWKLLTEEGKEVKTTTIHYIYRTPWIFSEDFYCEDRGPGIKNEKLRSGYFLEISASGKVFFYSISVEKIVPPPASNSDPHEDPFMYRIQDNNGDGIFETLLGGDIVVPDWVRK